MKLTKAYIQTKASVMQTTGLKLIWIFLLSSMASGAFAVQRSPWSFGYDILLLSDDNIGRSQLETDIEKDTITNLNLNGRYTWALNQTNVISLTGFTQIEKFQDFDGLSNHKLGMQFKYSFKTRFSFSSPLYSIFLRTSTANYETDIRDGTTTELGLQYLQQLTDRIAFVAGISTNRRDAESAVFDLKQNRYFINIDYQINNRWAFYISYTHIDGDVYSVATANQTIFNWADAIEADPAFTEISNQYGNNYSNNYSPSSTSTNPYTSPTATPYPSSPQQPGSQTTNMKYAYRLPAKTSLTRLGLNFGIDRNNSIDISVDIYSSDAAGPIDYEGTIFAANYLHRF